MSFLSRYWNAVERAVSETEMNPGDIVIDIAEVCKNTEVPNATELHTPVADQETIIRPVEDGPMPQYKTDFDVRESLARRSARRSEESSELEELQDTATKTPRNKIRGRLDEHDTWESSDTRAAKKASREDRIRKKKQLKKLGQGRKVRVTIDEVIIDDKPLWSRGQTH